MIYLGHKYNLIDTEDKLKALDSLLMDGDKPKHSFMAYDTETNGISLHESVVVGFSISFDSEKGYYIPLLIWEPDETSRKTITKDKVKIDACLEGRLRCNWTGEYFDEFVTPKEYDAPNRVPLIGALLKRWLKGTNLLMWNAPFDINMTTINFGVDLKDDLYLDGGLLVHILDENYSVALKPNAEKYKRQLGINPKALAAKEKAELTASIHRNGGSKAGIVWRADLEPQMKYACADTFFTYGICKAALQEFVADYGQDGVDWIFEKEVMPVCKEVVCDMKLRGVHFDVQYFEELRDETHKKMLELEDRIMLSLSKHNLLEGFNVGKSIEQEISKQAFVRELMRLEGLPIPTKTDKEGVVKESLAKGVVKKAYDLDPHWIYSYILGEGEIKYSQKRIDKIKADMYYKKVGKRYHFNIGSSAHLTWLFCERLDNDAAKLPQTGSATKDNPIPQMGADVLKEYMEPKYAWVSILLTWKKLQKLQSTYITPALNLHVDGWLYMDMKQNGTSSGRFACSGGYNLQTLPRVDDEMDALTQCASCGSEDVKIVQEIKIIADCKCNKCGHVERDIPRPSAIKRGFTAPKGYKIVNADYSSLEPRCFAFMSNDQVLKDVYLNDLDLYSQIYCQLFDPKGEYSADPKAPNFLKKVAKSKRVFIKPIVLSIPYGAEAGQVATLTGATKKRKGDDGYVQTIPDFKEGQRIIDAYLGGLPQLAKYMKNQDHLAATQGFVETLIGRRRHLPNAKLINDVLNANGYDYRDLKDASPSKLKKPKSGFVTHSGKAVMLTVDMLERIRVGLDIPKYVLAEKENWKFIRYLLKSDLNNSKNNPIQGLAGHITNKGMLEVARLYKEHNIDGWVALQVHDEIMTYVREDQAEFAATLLQRGMEVNEFTALVDLPMIAEPEICDNLMDSK